METELDLRFKALLHRVNAIVFCGTPHRGSGMTYWGQLAGKLVKVAAAESNQRIISDLEVDSQTLGLIQDDFLKTLHRMTQVAPVTIHSMLEGRAMSGVRGLQTKVSHPFPSFSCPLSYAV